jgi:hypothetical protein
MKQGTFRYPRHVARVCELPIINWLDSLRCHGGPNRLQKLGIQEILAKV